jgi:choline dehydrogenase-like flavoprotein
MKLTGHSNKQHPIAETWDAIVIGSGIGGLAAVALLAKHASQRVLVLERHYTAGGFTHAFRRPGYEWDAGVHYVGRVNDPSSPERAAFDHITEGRLAWNSMPDVYDQISIADRTYDFPTGLERFRARMGEAFPAERTAIDQYIALVCATVRAGNRYFAEKAIPGPLARLIGPMLRSGFLRTASQTTAQVLSQLTRNPELIAVLTAVGRLRSAARRKQLWRARHSSASLFRRRRLPGWRLVGNSGRHRAGDRTRGRRNYLQRRGIPKSCWIRASAPLAFASPMAANCRPAPLSATPARKILFPRCCRLGSPLPREYWKR